MADVGGIAGERLRSFIERIENLEEEKAALTADLREVYAEARAVGFDPKIMRQIVRLRKMESADRQEQEALLDTYMAALGMTGPVGPSEPAVGEEAGEAAPDTP